MTTEARKTRKVLDVNYGDKHFVCIYDRTVEFTPFKYNPFRLYQITYEFNGNYYTKRRKLYDAYADMESVLLALANLY